MSAQEMQVAPKQDESDGEKNQGLPARISQPVEPGSWRAALRSANDRRQQEDERHIAAEDVQFLKDGYALERRVPGFSQCRRPARKAPWRRFAAVFFP